MVAGALAVLAANSPLASIYVGLWEIPLKLSVGSFGLAKPILLWINDGLMAVFFLLVGLEIKREVARGRALGPLADRAARRRRDRRHARSSLIYARSICGNSRCDARLGDSVCHRHRVRARDPRLARPPCATGIESVADDTRDVDDLGAIVIIAIFYTSKFSLPALLCAGIALIALTLLNMAGVRRIAAYLLVGVVLWVCVLKSGVHATLAGVATAFAIPLRGEGPVVNRRCARSNTHCIRGSASHSAALCLCQRRSEPCRL